MAAAVGDPAFTAPPAIDITPALRGRRIAAAFRQGLTVAALLPDLHGRAAPPNAGDQP